MVDCTFGAGGHSLLFLKQFPQLKILGIDQDLDAIENGKKFLKENQVEDRVILVHSNMNQVGSIIEKYLDRDEKI